MLLLAASLPLTQKPQTTCSNLHTGECWYNPEDHVVGTIKNCATVQQCCAACDANPTCLAWTLNFASARTCYLKDGLEIKVNRGNCTSAGVRLPPAPTPPPPPPPPPPPHPKGAKNILMILIDDIRPEIGVYGSSTSQTPNFDTFAKTSLVLTNAYIQYSFCCPSRNSFLSGRRPSKTKTWTFQNHFREVGANWTAMPQWFKEHGYFTHGLGKLFHPNLPPNFDPPSWSDPGEIADGAGKLPLLPSVLLGVHETKTQYEYETAFAESNCITGEKGGSYCEINGTKGPDDALAANGATSLQMLANYTLKTGTPFFLGVGFHKPHIPWTIPTRFFRNTTIESTPLPLHEHSPLNMPPIAWNKGLGTHALDSYKDANAWPSHSFVNGTNVAFPHNLTRAMRRGYYAAVSYVDHLVGQVVGTLDSLDDAIRENTVVWIMGDHGYNLGELNLWCKVLHLFLFLLRSFLLLTHLLFSSSLLLLLIILLLLFLLLLVKMTVFESGTRVPLFIRVPGLTDAGVRSASLAEAVDIFPSLVELATGLPAPEYCDGDSLAPIVKSQGTATVKTAAYSEFVKCYSCCRVPDDESCLPGGTGGRCVPTSAQGLEDLHEMVRCVCCTQPSFRRHAHFASFLAHIPLSFSLYFSLALFFSLSFSLSLSQLKRAIASGKRTWISISSVTPRALRNGGTRSGCASTPRCCMGIGINRSWAESCTITAVTTAEHMITIGGRM